MGGIMAIHRVMCGAVAVIFLAVMGTPSKALAEDGDGKKWALLGLDVGLGLTAVVALINHNKAVDEYNSLWVQIDNTSPTNFLMLQAKEQDVNSKKRAATILGIGAGLSIGYTLADALFLHKFFPKTISLGIDPLKTAVAMKITFW